MNLDELKSTLDAAGISDDAYSFTSDGYGEVFRIARSYDLVGEGWEVYYAERGQKNGLLVFRSESEACNEFLRRILKDSAVRRSAISSQNRNEPNAVKEPLQQHLPL